MTQEFGGQRLVPVITGLWGETLGLIIRVVEQISAMIKPPQASAASTSDKEKTD